MLNVYQKLKNLINSKVPMDNAADSNVNCNNYTKTGIYYLGTNLSNAPSSWIKLMVMGNSNTTNGDIVQLAVCVTTRQVYTRSATAQNGSFVWKDWLCLNQIITTGTEFETGRIIDDKKEYAKRINCGALFESGIKTVETGLSNVTYTDIEGICVTSGGGWPYKMGTTGSSAVAVLSIDNNQIKIESNGNLSTYTGYVELKYLKN